MYTLHHYEAMAEQVRKIMISGKPVPKEYSEIIEEFMPTEEKYPDRRVVTIYEYPDSNPSQFLENKRGFRLQFMFLFLSNEQAANFYEEVCKNGSLKWQIARFFLEVAENMVFVKTRGQRASNILEKIEKAIKTQPLCIFHYNLKMRELLFILEESNWCLRVVWGPAINVPLHGGTLEKQEDLLIKNEPKLEIKYLKEEIEPPLKKKQQQQDDPSAPLQILVSDQAMRSISFFEELALKTSQRLLQQSDQ